MSYDDLISTSTSVRSIKARYYLITFLVWFATALPMALSVLLVQARGVGLAQVGFVLGAYSLVIVLLEVPTGGLADGVGRGRVALLSAALAALSSAALLFAFSFPAFLAAMLVYGVSRALSSGALDAWFVDALHAADPQADLQPALAGAETVTLAALGLGTLLGGALPQWFASLPPDGAAVLSPLAVPVAAALGVRLLLLPLIPLLIREARPAGGTSWRGGFAAVPALVRDAARLTRANRSLSLLMTASFAAGFALIGLEAFWQPFFAALPETSGRPFLFGALMAGSFLAGMGGNLLAAPLARRWGGRLAPVAALSRLLAGLAVVALAASGGFLPGAAAFWLAYLGLGLGASPHSTLVNDEIPAAQRSTMLSVQSLALYVGGFLGGATLGRLAEGVSIPAAWVVVGGVLAVSLLPYLLLERRPRQLPDAL